MNNTVLQLQKDPSGGRGVLTFLTTYVVREVSEVGAVGVDVWKVVKAGGSDPPFASHLLGAAIGRGIWFSRICAQGRI